MVNLWCEPKKLYGRFMVDECIVVSLAPPPRHLIVWLTQGDVGIARRRKIVLFNL